MLKTRILFIIILLLSLLTISGCRRNPPNPQDQELATYEHKVLYAGETLGSIAKWYTGSLDNWRAILKHNPGLDEKRIRIGQVIKIPKTLMIKTQPMPKNFIASSTSTNVNTSPQTNEPFVSASEPGGKSNSEPEESIANVAPTVVATVAPTATVETKPSKSPAEMEKFDFDDDSQPATKTRDELLKELTEDY